MVGSSQWVAGSAERHKTPGMRGNRSSVVALRPKFGGYLVAAWLAGIIASLLLQADFYDIALRDFGLLLAALTLARLATAFDRAPSRA